MSWLSLPDASAEGAPPDLVIDPVTKDLGDGFRVRRALPSAGRKMVGPFVFLDHMGPAILAPGKGLDVRPHPHIGLATLTYLTQGQILHRDSLGVSQAIDPGDVNWMTAGRGIVHSERTEAGLRAQGHTLTGLQSWIFVHRSQDRIEAAKADWKAGRFDAVPGDGEFIPLPA